MQSLYDQVPELTAFGHLREACRLLVRYEKGEGKIHNIDANITTGFPEQQSLPAHVLFPPPPGFPSLSTCTTLPQPSPPVCVQGEAGDKDACRCSAIVIHSPHTTHALPHPHTHTSRQIGKALSAALQAGRRRVQSAVRYMTTETGGTARAASAPGCNEASTGNQPDD